MALDTWDSLWRKVHLRCPMAGPLLAQDWVQTAFRQLWERRRWSWQVKNGQFLVNTVYNTGKITTVFNSNTVTGIGTGWTSALLGRQFRVPITDPIYTIMAVNSATQLVLDQPYGGNTQGPLGYQIYNAYLTVPQDFDTFVSVFDPQFNWQLWTNVAQEEINSWDAQRAQQGTGWVVAQYDYDQLMNGYPAGTPPLPRYEIWPHQMTQKPYPFLYQIRYPDLTDTFSVSWSANAQPSTLPRYIRGDVLVEGALELAAMWPGPSRDKPNPYFNQVLAQQHHQRYETSMKELEVADDNRYLLDVRYGQLAAMPFAVIPLGDANYLQSHAI